MTNDGLLDGDADEPRSWDFGRGLGATSLKNLISQDLENLEKPF